MARYVSKGVCVPVQLGIMLEIGSLTNFEEVSNTVVPNPNCAMPVCSKLYPQLLDTAPARQGKRRAGAATSAQILS